jgi:hypothetical protein
MTSNYLKLVYQDPLIGAPAEMLFFFDSNRQSSLELAWRNALAALDTTGGKLSSCYPIRFRGPWDKASLVGFRDKGDIMEDMAKESKTKEHNRLSEELLSRSAYVAECLRGGE